MFAKHLLVFDYLTLVGGSQHVSKSSHNGLGRDSQGDNPADDNLSAGFEQHGLVTLALHIRRYADRRNQHGTKREKNGRRSRPGKRSLSIHTTRTPI